MEVGGGVDLQGIGATQDQELAGLRGFQEEAIGRIDLGRPDLLQGRSLLKEEQHPNHLNT
jgi:hypothetical protein